MKKRRIVMIWVGMAVVSALSLAAMAEPAKDAPRKRGAEPDKVAREAGEISRWLIEHPGQAERILLNLRKQRGGDAAATARRRPGKAEMTDRSRQQRGNQMDRRQQRGNQMGQRQQRGNQMDRRQQRGNQMDRRQQRGNQMDRRQQRGNQMDRRQQPGNQMGRRPEIAQRLDRLEAMVKRLAAQMENLREGATPQREGRAMRRRGETPQREGRAMRRGGETPQREGRAFRR